MARIYLEKLTKIFGEQVAVNDLTLELKDREFSAILGPSGCGKTTTMNMIAGLETPTGGEVYFDEARVTDVPAEERRVGFVFQNYAIFTHMSVFENLAAGLRIRKVPHQEMRKQVIETARLLQLEEVLSQSAGKLSVNLMQKVAVGRSMITKPQIFLLDEPLSNLDAAFREVMRGELKRLQRELGQTMIYVTHDQVEAMSMADWIAVMDFGNLMQYGTPEEIYHHPRNLFVAGFIGTPPINLISGTFRTEGDKAFFKGDPFTIDLTHRRREIEQGLRGDQIVLGARPKRVRVSPTPSEDGLTPGTVEVVEHLGSETILHLRVNDLVVRASIPSAFDVKIGGRRWVQIDGLAVHVFDAETGRAVF